MVVSSLYDKLQLKLRLVDVGTFLSVPAEVVTDIPDKLLEDAGQSIWCHLEGVPLADVVLSSTSIVEVLEELPDDRMVDLVHRGGDPVQVDGGYYSLPVDLFWTTTFVPGPLLPTKSIFHSLTDKVLEKMGVQKHMDNLLEPSDDDQEDKEEFASFHWRMLKVSAGCRLNCLRRKFSRPLEHLWTRRGRYSCSTTPRERQ